MVTRDKNGKVTGVTICYGGINFYITENMLAGKIMLCDSMIKEALELAKQDPETRAAINEMVQSIGKAWE